MNGVRWNQPEGYFEGRCDGCSDWLPLTPEERHDLWPVKGRGLRICRACDNLRALARSRGLRANPEYRSRESARNRLYWQALPIEERRVLKRIYTFARLDKHRAYHREYARRQRAQQREDAA